jgi:hypothetical protein
MVLNLWAITTVVFPFIIYSSASYTFFSLLASNAEVASSKISILGLEIAALAIAILYFYPPDNYVPFAPANVSNPPLNFFMKS